MSLKSIAKNALRVGLLSTLMSPLVACSGAGAVAITMYLQKTDEIEGLNPLFSNLPDIRDREIKRINQEYYPFSPKNISYLGWGAGIGALVGVGLSATILAWSPDRRPKSWYDDDYRSQWEQ